MKTDPRRMLGQKFDVLGYSETSYVEEFRADEGMDPDWSVEFRDNSLQFLLTESRIVKTVFVLSEGFISDLAGTKASVATLSDVIKRFGAPTNFGAEADYGVLGRNGAWLRYDGPAQVTHFEFFPGGIGICMVTLMVPEHAP